MTTDNILNDQHAGSLREMVLLNLASLLHHPAYASLPEGAKFSFFRNADSPFGCSIQKWISNAIILGLTMLEHEGEDLSVSMERAEQKSGDSRSDEVVELILSGFLDKTKAEILADEKCLVESFKKADAAGGQG